jgi:hypothetical protein
MYGSMPRVLLISNSVTTTPGGPDIKYALCWGGNRQHSKTQDHMWEPEERVQIDRGEKQCEEEKGGTYSAAKRIPKLAAVVSLAQICAGGNQSALRLHDLVTKSGEAYASHHTTHMTCERKVCGICP